MNGGLAFGTVMPPGAQPKQTNGQPDVGASAEARKSAENLIGANNTNSKSASVTQLQTAVAIKPTPIAASAVKIEMSTESRKEAEFASLPITGPDKFAEGVAFQNQKKHEAEIRTLRGEPSVEPVKAAEKPVVLDSIDRKIEKAQAEGPKEPERAVGADDKPVLREAVDRQVEKQQAEGPKEPERAVGAEEKPVAIREAERQVAKQQAEGPNADDRGGSAEKPAVYRDAERIAEKQQATGAERDEVAA